VYLLVRVLCARIWMFVLAVGSLAGKCVPVSVLCTCASN
jgi:hypothetical protein